MADKADYTAPPAVLARFRELLATVDRDDAFGNGRYARNVLEEAIGRHAWRLRDVEKPTPGSIAGSRPGGPLGPVEPAVASADAPATPEPLTYEPSTPRGE